ncbi:chitin synthase regulator Skt5p [[Candida] railenensis]|uniref:Chitin synthase regulator Skt5p n=1 Tax=[Candida] railenensis TaxID=45579 RepID=A0A9P0QV57_9ASCO|nr:chitin synthase regulator Skt5p [[Candida] railenensis]
MSAHPYRMKAVGGGSAPYPTDNGVGSSIPLPGDKQALNHSHFEGQFGGARASKQDEYDTSTDESRNSASEYSNGDQTGHIMPGNGFGDQGVHGFGSSRMGNGFGGQQSADGMNGGGGVGGVGNGFGLQGPNFSHKQQASVGSIGSGTGTGSSSGSASGSQSTDVRDVYERSPPPIFSKNKSPPYNSRSVNSSITNLRINQQQQPQGQLQHDSPGQGPSGSRFELTSKSESNIPQQRSTYTHQRQVSSNSSFIDRTDTASMADNSHNIIQQYLGSNSHRAVPRIKTLELYRQNAKKSDDPLVLFEYAQYMLQTALMMENGEVSLGGSKNNSPGSSLENSPLRSKKNKSRPASAGSFDRLMKNHKKSPSNSNLSVSDEETIALNDMKLKKELLNEALLYLRKLSDKGYVDAQYLLADAHSSGALGKVENRYSFSLFQSAAKHGHVESAYRTSYCYEEGLGTGRDARKALEYLKMAASKNHPAAMYKLGVYSFYNRMGLGNDVNTKKMGIKWLTRASNIATELTAAAPFELGKIYFTGFLDILIKDEKYALELYSKAAALGHIESAKILGQYYEVGDILPQDSNLSIHYYTQAALGGDAEAMLAMCAWYLVGSEPFLPKDESEAFEWALRSANANFVKAQYALGNFFEKGVGCEKNVKESQEWYKKAAENGDEKSLARILDKDWVTKYNKNRKKNKKITKTGAPPPPTAPSIPSDGNKSKVKSNAAEEKECVIM